jgi:hypothetical protein
LYGEFVLGNSSARQIQILYDSIVTKADDNEGGDRKKQPVRGEQLKTVATPAKGDGRDEQQHPAVAISAVLQFQSPKTDSACIQATLILLERRKRFFLVHGIYRSSPSTTGIPR